MAQRLEAEAQGRRANLETLRAQEQLVRAERLVYAGKLMLAQTDFEAGNGGLASHYLDGCQPNLRGWEYRYLRTRISAARTLAGHTKDVTSAAFSPGGKRVVTGSGDGTTRVWDAVTGAELLAVNGPAGRNWRVAGVWGMAFGPDGKRFVSGGQAKTATVRDAETGEEILTLAHANVVSSVAYSSDGGRIATGIAGANGTVKHWYAAPTPQAPGAPFTRPPGGRASPALPRGRAGGRRRVDDAEQLHRRRHHRQRGRDQQRYVLRPFQPEPGTLRYALRQPQPDPGRQRRAGPDRHGHRRPAARPSGGQRRPDPDPGVSARQPRHQCGQQRPRPRRRHRRPARPPAQAQRHGGHRRL